MQSTPSESIRPPPGAAIHHAPALSGATRNRVTRAAGSAASAVAAPTVTARTRSSAAQRMPPLCRVRMPITPFPNAFRKMKPVSYRQPARGKGPAGGIRRPAFPRPAMLAWIALVAAGALTATLAQLAATGPVALPFVAGGWSPLDAALRAARAAGGVLALALTALAAGAAVRRFITGRARL